MYPQNIPQIFPELDLVIFAHLLIPSQPVLSLFSFLECIFCPFQSKLNKSVCLLFFLLLTHLSTSVTGIGEGNGTSVQSSCLENPMGGGAWWAAVHGVAKSQTQLSDFTFTFHFHAFEKAMATHSSVLAWRIPGTGEPGGLLSVGSHRVGHD